MEKSKLTDARVRAMRPAPAGKRLLVWDALTPSLAVRVTDRGAKTFIVISRPFGSTSPKFESLGRYPGMTLAEARAKAVDVLHLHAAGKRPAEAALASRRAEEERRANTFAALCEEFITKHVHKQRSARAVEAIVRRDLIARWGTRPVGDVTRRDVIRAVEEVSAARGPSAAHKVLAEISKIHNWALSHAVPGVTVNPCAAVRGNKDIIAPVPARTRVLGDDELRRLWDAAGAMGYPFGPLYRVLALTGQRLNEIAEAQWSEITGLDGPAPCLTIPASRMKGKAAHSVPLTPTAVAILQELPRFAFDFIFTTTGGRRPVSGFSKPKKRLDEAIGEIAPFKIHDIRRTVRTGLSTAGVLPMVAEMVIAHRQTGIAAVYDLYRFDGEKRAALRQWEARLLAITGAM